MNQFNIINFSLNENLMLLPKHLTPLSVYVRQWNFTAKIFLCSYKSQRSELTVNIYDRIVLSSVPMLVLLNK